MYAHNGGRPDAVAQFFFNFQKKWIAEFTIIPEANVTILRSDREHWKPSEYVTKFADLPNSRLPAKPARPGCRCEPSPRTSRRLITGGSGGQDGLRCSLNRPTGTRRKYDPRRRMFIFAHGANPECCVLLEAYEDAKGSRYRFAVAPMSIYKLEVRYKDAAVWSVERRHPGRKATSYYADAYKPDPGETLPE